MASDIDWLITDEHVNVDLELRELDWLLAHMLLNRVVFINNHWSEKAWTEEARQGYLVLVICNDAFGPGSDCEPAYLEDLIPLYKMWRAAPGIGEIAWCIARRKQATWPIKKYREDIEKLGWSWKGLLRGELPLL